MKKILLMLSVALVALTSCNSDNADNYITATFDMAATVSGTESDFYSSAVAVKIDFNKQTGTFTIKNIKSPDGNTYSNVSVEVPFTYGKYANYEFKASVVEAVSGLERLALNNFVANCGTYDNRLQFTLDGCNYYFVVKNAGFPKATTVVTDYSSSDSKPYSNETTQYVLAMNPEKKSAILYLYKAKFAENMPKEFDMVFEGLTLDANGVSFIASSESLEPKIGDTPYPRYQITDLVVTLTAPNLAISFTCAGIYHVTATATMVTMTEE